MVAGIKVVAYSEQAHADWLTTVFLQDDRYLNPYEKRTKHVALGYLKKNVEVVEAIDDWEGVWTHLLSSNSCSRQENGSPFILWTESAAQEMF